MRVGSLFSGIGGVELGLERAGFETAWFVENDSHAQAVLRKHWPDTPIYGDITTVNFTTVQPIDVLTGGFPCQDISKAGKGAGIEGSRSGLWKHYLRAIRILRPRLVFAENVSMLTDRGLNVVLADLAALGYDAEWHCVPAAAVGAPHRRDRIIILAYPNGQRRVHGQAAEQPDSRGEYAQRHPGEGGPDVAYTDQGQCDESTGTLCSGRTPPHSSSKDVPNSDEQGLSQSGPAGKQELRAQKSTGMDHRPEQRGWWKTEPALGRVADGVPHRVDRIKRLGNAVVPQWAQAVGEAIQEVEREQ